MNETVIKLIKQIEPELKRVREERDRIRDKLSEGVDVGNFHYVNSLYMSMELYLSNLHHLRRQQFPVPPRKVYVRETILIPETSAHPTESVEAYFIFERMKGKYLKLKEYGNGKQYYWFDGLRGVDWERGGHYHKPIINPSLKYDNIQGFTDGEDVWFLREVTTDKPNLCEYGEYV